MTNNNLPARREAEFRYDDEISLVELWLVLAKHRLVIVLSTLALGALGVAYALLTPAQYEYSTSLQIGSRLAGSDYRLIEPPAAVVARINRGYLPVLHRELVPERERLEIEARTEGDGGLIVVSGEATEEDGELFLGILSRVSDKVIEEHERLIDDFRQQLVLQQQQANIRLEALQAEAEDVRKRLEQLDKLLQSMADRTRGVEGAGLLAQLQSAEQAETLRQELADNAVSQREERALLAELASQLGTFRPTTTVAEPLQSVEQVGTSNRLIVALAVVLGLMLGVFAAFFMGFLQHVREVQHNAEPS